MVHPTSRLATRLLIGFAALAAVSPAFAAPDAAKQEPDLRAYDGRPALPAARAAVDTAQAIDRLRVELPGLLVSFDERTGATRTLSNAAGYLTGPSGGDAERIALDFAYSNLDLLGLGADDLRDYEVTDRAYSGTTGVTHLYLRQRHAGYPLYNGQLHVNVAADGRILSVNNLFVPGLASAANATRPAISGDDAVAAFARHQGVEALEARPSEPTLMYLAIRPGVARLVWNFHVDLERQAHWFDVNVDAIDGRVWTRFDWVADVNDYRVYQRPVEAPTFVAPLPPADGRTLQTNPANATASPFGWHDTNGVAGNEFTRTRGNNAHAYTDTDANNVPDAGSDPECGASIVCDFPLDLTQPPSAYRPGAVANLFYWNNVIHDVSFLYGFTPVNGNFQVNTYGGGGTGNDDVQAEAQDGAGTNNANFATPPDGSRPRMQMFVWTAPTPDRDGDVDNGIIVHEYGHGISNRLVGGPANVSCLQNAEQPGEGLSDWWTLFFTHEAANPDVRGIGTYALNQPTTGPGIRTQRYDKAPEPNTNTWTYASVMGSVIPHGVGEKWAQAYWYAQGRLQDEHGFNPNTYAFTGTAADAGNIRAMFYIIEGLENAVCSPGFVDVRNAIIAAATASYSGSDVCLLWQAFADYGLGFSASQGSSSSINDQTPAFDIPPACSLVGAPADAQVCIGQNFSDSVTVGSAFTPPVTMSTSGVPAPATSSFSPNPVPGPLPNTTTLTIANTAGVAPGTYTITVTGNGGGTGSDTFDLEFISGNPGAFNLTAPINGISVPTVRPNFTWSASPNAADYEIQIDDTADFSSPVYTATVAGTSHTPTSDLPSNVLLYWRVRAQNGCGITNSPVFHFAAAPPASVCRTPNLAIPDNVPAGVNDVLVVATGGAISDLNVSLVVTHTWVGDLRATISNGGAPVELYDRPGVPTTTFGCDGDDIDVVINDQGADGNVETQCDNLPASHGDRVGGDPPNTSALAGFNGQPLADTWTLNISDNVGADIGTLDEWCLITPNSMPFLDSFETNNTSRWSSTTP